MKDWCHTKAVAASQVLKGCLGRGSSALWPPDVKDADVLLGLAVRFMKSPAAQA